ncbi:hypothetical protein [Vibrio apostichopi]|uniref:hypothetical protein n=1 Tax=Vibrio apostichopi TaxID=3035453 RepID=UPI0025726C3B|nr:hypothetical protein [Vibrio sp. FE10]
MNSIKHTYLIGLNFGKEKIKWKDNGSDIDNSKGNIEYGQIMQFENYDKEKARVILLCRKLKGNVERSYFTGRQAQLYDEFNNKTNLNRALILSYGSSDALVAAQQIYRESFGRIEADIKEQEALMVNIIKNSLGLLMTFGFSKVTAETIAKEISTKTVETIMSQKDAKDLVLSHCEKPGNINSFVWWYIEKTSTNKLNREREALTNMYNNLIYTINFLKSNVDTDFKSVEVEQYYCGAIANLIMATESLNYACYERTGNWITTSKVNQEVLYT